MPITHEDLHRAVERGVLSRDQAEALWNAASTGEPPRPAPSGPVAPRPVRHAAGVLIALAAAAAATWLLVLACERFGGLGTFALSGAYAITLVIAARELASQRQEGAAGVLVAAAVALVPIAVHGLEHGLGLFTEISTPTTLDQWILGRAFWPSAAAVIAAFVAAERFRFPFLAAVGVAAVWFAAQLGASVAFNAEPTWSERALVSSLVGLVALAVGIAVDGRTRRDWASWFYFSGLVAFWGGLTSYHPNGAMTVVAAIVNVWLVVVAVVLRRRMFAVFGAVGIAGLLGDAAERLLTDAAEPFAFAAILVGLVFVSVAYVRFEEACAQAMIRRLPDIVRRVVAPRAWRTRL